MSSGAVLYTQGFGSKAENVEIPLISNRNPNSSDINYPIGKRWINSNSNNEFVLVSKSSFQSNYTANWQSLKNQSYSISSIGQGTLVAGTVTINDPNCLSSSFIMLSKTSITGEGSILYVNTISNGTFTVTSLNSLETSNFVYMIVN